MTSCNRGLEIVSSAGLFVALHDNFPKETSSCRAF